MWSQCNLNLMQLWFKMNKDELQSRWIWLTFTFFLPNTSPYQKPNGHTERRKTLCYADDLQMSLYLQRFDFYISIWNLSKIIKKPSTPQGTGVLEEGATQESNTTKKRLPHTVQLSSFLLIVQQFGQQTFVSLWSHYMLKKKKNTPENWNEPSVL